MLNKCYIGDCRVGLRAFVAAGLQPQMCVTSPPYWGLRDYGIEPSIWGGLPDCAHEWGDKISIHKGGPTGETSGLTNRGANQARANVADSRAGQFCECGAWLGTLGLEPDPRMYIDHIVEVIALVREVLAHDGTFWLNLGDSYNSIGHKKSHSGYGSTGLSGGKAQEHSPTGRENSFPGLKHKDLCLMPARVAIALQESGWWVRQDIIWHKPNPMPESVKDRCTKAHEYIFLLSKSQRYYYDADAIRETSEHGYRTNPNAAPMTGRSAQSSSMWRGAGDRKTQVERGFDQTDATYNPSWARNKRSVWTVSTQPYPDAHFATFPRRLIEPCILAGSRPGDIVLDPFMGSGTTAQVAEQLGRKWLGCEINPDYVDLQANRLRQQHLELATDCQGHGTNTGEDDGKTT